MKQQAQRLATCLQAQHAKKETAAATLQAEIEKQYEAKLSALLAREDYAGASALKKEKESGRWAAALTSMPARAKEMGEAARSQEAKEEEEEEDEKQYRANLAEIEKQYGAKLTALLAREDYHSASAFKKDYESGRLAAAIKSSAQHAAN